MRSFLVLLGLMVVFLFADRITGVPISAINSKDVSNKLDNANSDDETDTESEDEEEVLFDDDLTTRGMERLSSAATCLVAGVEYTHGQQIYREDQCEFCLCLDGEMFCWWQECPPALEGPCKGKGPYSQCKNVMATKPPSSTTTKSFKTTEAIKNNSKKPENNISTKNNNNNDNFKMKNFYTTKIIIQKSTTNHDKQQHTTNTNNKTTQVPTQETKKPQNEKISLTQKSNTIFSTAKFEPTKSSIIEMPSAFSVILNSVKLTTKEDQISEMKLNFNKAETSTSKTTTEYLEYCVVMGKKYKIGEQLPHSTGNCIECICDEGAKITCSPHQCAPAEEDANDYRPPGAPNLMPEPF